MLTSLVFVILTVCDVTHGSDETLKNADREEEEEYCSDCDDRWKEDNSVLADEGYTRDVSIDTSQCNYPCKCTNTELRCKAGVNVVKDGCDCCYMCSRQQGDLCDYKDKCDDDKGFYCDFRFDGGARGICRAREALSCEVEGNTYKDGEEFKPDCRRLCSCQNGRHACSTLCPQEDRRPSSVHCPSPRLIEISGKCCREWTCPSHNEATAMFPSEEEESGVQGGYTRVVGSQIIGSHTDTAGDEVSGRTDGKRNDGTKECKKETTAWSTCSKTCDMGFSIRVTNDNEQCVAEEQRRLCLVRPCELQDKHLGGKKCRSTWKIKSTHMSYENCKSVAEYQPKFCSTCKRRKCCAPGRTKTIQMEFTCPDGRQVVESFMWIKNCECHKDRRCPWGTMP